KEAAELFAKIAPAHQNDANFSFQFGLAQAHVGRTREALSAYAHALLLQPDFSQALDQLAWILSTDPHPEFRNGTQAVPLAERACELTERKDAEKLKTLAAAYAEAGRFSDAVATAQKAQQLAEAGGKPQLARDCEALMEAFKEGKSW